MGRTVLLIEPYLTIKVDTETNILFADWWGDVTKQNVLDGSVLVREALEREKCTKVLNSNSNVRGFWKATARWSATVGFPALESTSCEYFAWVKAPQSNLPPDYVYRLNLKKLKVGVFHNLLAAERWLVESPVLLKNDVASLLEY